jgi:hypothetical protein
MAANIRELSELNAGKIKASLIRTLIASVGAGLLLGSLGPFGTYENIPAFQRFTFWMLIMLAGSFVHMPLFWLFRLFGEAKNLSPLIWVPAAAAIAAAPTVLLVNGLVVAILGPVRLDSFFGLYPYVLVISLPAMVIAYIAERVPVSAPIAEPTPHPAQAINTKPVVAASASSPDFLAKLPPQIGRELLCLEMEDHYVRVHTALGSHLLLLRMADAEAQLASVDGMRVHRSWWVARTAVTSWRRDGKSLTLRLNNDRDIPVARDRQPLVKAAGWLTD